MSRLIDADKLKESLIKEYLRGKKTIVEVIDGQPTAFDVDKISKELVKQKKNANKKMNESDDAYSMSYYDGFLSGIAIAIGIVKGGGVDGN
nr:MAG TPA: hypothetical protein [Caudoviricetes sp.]